MARLWFKRFRATILSLGLASPALAQTGPLQNPNRELVLIPVQKVQTGGLPAPQVLPPATSPYSPMKSSFLANNPPPPPPPVGTYQMVPVSSLADAPCPCEETVPGPPVKGRMEAFLRKIFFDCNNQKVPSLPLGETVYKPLHTQVANGIAARMILYDYDFIHGTAKLNPRGKERIAWIANMFVHFPNPIRIEPTPWNPVLAENRRLTVLQELAPFIGVTDQTVVIGRPLANGLMGPETEILYQNFLANTINGGPFGGFQGGSGTGQSTGTTGGFPTQSGTGGQ